ncbi:MAG: hypothetical protein Q7R98_01625 [Candidatus Jorgensenbacteria bacterium]|nr:hypothetical protein [Candidatus Jorgensenbacteria bacterium]
MNTTADREKSLLKHKKEIETQLKKLGSGFVDFGNDVDPDEETEESEEKSNRMGVKRVFENQLKEINKTLESLKKSKKGNSSAKPRAGKK